MQIDLFADVVCPWCYIGSAELQRALRQVLFAADVSVRMRSFQLDPAAPAGVRPLGEVLGGKYGAEAVAGMMERVAARGRIAGVEIALDPETSPTGNTMLAHMLLQAAGDDGLQLPVATALYRSYFSQGRSLFDEDSLRSIATGAGMAPEHVEAAFRDPSYRARVRSDGERAESLGIRSVPFFVIDDRYGISGAQSAAALREALQTIHAAA